MGHERDVQQKQSSSLDLLFFIELCDDPKVSPWGSLLVNQWRQGSGRDTARIDTVLTTVQSRKNGISFSTTMSHERQHATTVKPSSKNAPLYGVCRRYSCSFVHRKRHLTFRIHYALAALYSPFDLVVWSSRTMPVSSNLPRLFLGSALVNSETETLRKHVNKKCLFYRETHLLTLRYDTIPKVSHVVSSVFS